MNLKKGLKYARIAGETQNVPAVRAEEKYWIMTVFIVFIMKDLKNGHQEFARSLKDSGEYP